MYNEQQQFSFYLTTLDMCANSILERKAGLEKESKRKRMYVIETNVRCHILYLLDARMQKEHTI